MLTSSRDAKEEVARRHRCQTDWTMLSRKKRTQMYVHLAPVMARKVVEGVPAGTCRDCLEVVDRQRQTVRWRRILVPSCW